MNIRNLRVNRLREPIGVDWQAPIFSFQSDREGVFLVSLYTGQDKLAVQERTVTDKNCGGFCFPLPLQPETAYRWSVFDGREELFTCFETGIDTLPPPLYIEGARGDERAAVCRFYAPLTTRYARLYLAGEGVRCLVNGEHLGLGYPCTDTSKGTPRYRTYDISRLLGRGGENDLRLCPSTNKPQRIAASVVIGQRDGKKQCRGLCLEDVAEKYLTAGKM